MSRGCPVCFGRGRACRCGVVEDDETEFEQVDRTREGLLDRAGVLALLRTQEGHPDEAEVIRALVREVRSAPTLTPPPNRSLPPESLASLRADAARARAAGISFEAVREILSDHLHDPGDTFSRTVERLRDLALRAAEATNTHPPTNEQNR